jgi:hypothetical protein
MQFTKQVRIRRVIYLKVFALVIKCKAYMSHLRSNVQSLILLIDFADLKNGNAEITFHLPMAEFTCTGKYVWCGNNEPVDKEIMDNIWKMIQNSKRNKDLLLCFFMWRSASVNSNAAPFHEDCQRLIPYTSRFVCEIPST